MNTTPPRTLTRYTVEQLHEAMRARAKMDKRKVLDKERRRFLREAAKLNRRIARMDEVQPEVPKATMKAKEARVRRKVRRWKMSPAARKKIAESQRKRWAAIRARAAAKVPSV